MAMISIAQTRFNIEHCKIEDSFFTLEVCGRLSILSIPPNEFFSAHVVGYLLFHVKVDAFYRIENIFCY